MLDNTLKKGNNFNFFKRRKSSEAGSAPTSPTSSIPSSPISSAPGSPILGKHEKDTVLSLAFSKVTNAVDQEQQVSDKKLYKSWEEGSNRRQEILKQGLVPRLSASVPNIGIEIEPVISSGNLSPFAFPRIPSKDDVRIEQQLKYNEEKKRVSKLEEEVESLRSTAEQQENKYKKEIIELSAELEKQKNLIEGIQEELTKSQSENENMFLALDLTENSWKHAWEKKQEAEEKLQGFEKRIQVVVDKVEDEKKKLERQLEEKQEEIVSIQAIVNEVEDKKKEFEKQLGEKEERIVGIQAVVDKVEDEKKELKRQLEENKIERKRSTIKQQEATQDQQKVVERANKFSKYMLISSAAIFTVSGLSKIPMIGNILKGIPRVGALTNMVSTIGLSLSIAGIGASALQRGINKSYTGILDNAENGKKELTR